MSSAAPDPGGITPLKAEMQDQNAWERRLHTNGEGSQSAHFSTSPKGLARTNMELPDHSTSLIRIPTPLLGSGDCRVNSLPNELVSEVLIAAVLPRQKADGKNDLLDRLRFPLIARSVCRRWWHITQTTPALWAILHLAKSPTHHVNRIQSSRNVPLEVYVESRSPTVLGEPSILQSCAERIWKLDIGGDTAVEVYEAIRNCPVEFTNLLDLSIHADYDAFGQSTQLKLSLPRLRSLHLRQYCLNWTDLPVSTLLEELHVVESRGCSVHITLFIATLHACPRLRVLELGAQILTGCQPSALEALRPFALDQLEELSLKQFYRHELQNIFDLIRTPKVRSLAIEGLSDSLWTPEDGVVIDSHKPLDLKFPVLETLVVERLDLSTEIVKMLPDVKHLAYLYHPFTEEQGNMDLEFRRLLTIWDYLPNPSPLETLKTRGVSLSSLLAFFEGGTHKMFPLLRKLFISSRDTPARRESSEETLGTWGNEGTKLAAFVELEVYRDDDTGSDSPVSVV